VALGCNVPITSSVYSDYICISNSLPLAMLMSYTDTHVKSSTTCSAVDMRVI